MAPTPVRERQRLSQGLLDVLIRAGLVAILVIICYRVFHPFMNLMLWALILAVTLYPLQRRLKRKWGSKDGRTATLIVLVAISVLLVPVYLIGVSIATSAESALATSWRLFLCRVPPPYPSRRRLPLWQPLHCYWEQAATDMTGLTKNSHRSRRKPRHAGKSPASPLDC